jgi:hypothetical protein
MAKKETRLWDNYVVVSFMLTHEEGEIYIHQVPLRNDVKPNPKPTPSKQSPNHQHKTIPRWPHQTTTQTAHNQQPTTTSPLPKRGNGGKGDTIGVHPKKLLLSWELVFAVTPQPLQHKRGEFDRGTSHGICFLCI